MSEASTAPTRPVCWDEHIAVHRGRLKDCPACLSYQRWHYAHWDVEGHRRVVDEVAAERRRLAEEKRQAEQAERERKAGEKARKKRQAELVKLGERYWVDEEKLLVFSFDELERAAS